MYDADEDGNLRRDAAVIECCVEWLRGGEEADDGGQAVHGQGQEVQAQAHLVRVNSRVNEKGQEIWAGAGGGIVYRLRQEQEERTAGHVWCPDLSREPD